MKLVGKNKKVLDVGCSTGFLARLFKKNGCYVCGIEIDREAAEIAKKYCDKIIVKDVEQIKNLPYPPGFFDVIVYGDVLEHLKRPDLVLLNLRKYLTPKGIVIASIPNIAYWGIRLKLLFGKFDYRERGILDPGHLRFFTKTSIIQLFKDAGFKIIKIGATGWRFHWLRELFPTLLSNQFIVAARRTE
ncbi:MAG: class I SAM-dependent methyltransferase [Candidatus Hadarchaeales archaeon]